MAEEIFTKLYSGNAVEEISMNRISVLMQNEENRKLLAEYIYQRFYTRYLKIFDYDSSELFRKQYKSGFLIMTSCCIVIENFASFLDGSNKTPFGKGDERFKAVFKYAEKYGNKLHELNDCQLYSNIRNGLLHQGETYNNFKIKRKGDLIDGKTINATRILVEINKLLLDYKEELSDNSVPWDGVLWDSCRMKLREIIKNCSK
jgi:hypothetical protein